MKVSPLEDRIIVEQLEESEKTTSGLIVPGKNIQNLKKGTVIAIGPGRILDTGEAVPSELKVGGLVFYPKHLAVEIPETKYAIIREKDIIARIEEE